MRIVYNPKAPEGSTLSSVGYKALSDAKGFYYSLPAGKAAKFRDDVAEFLLKTYGFLKELNDKGEVILALGKIISPPEKTDIELEKIGEFHPTKELPNLVEKRLHPEKYQDDNNETNGTDFYGEGLETDTPDSGWTPPKSKFVKE